MRWLVNENGVNTDFLFDDGIPSIGPGDEKFTRNYINTKVLLRPYQKQTRILTMDKADVLDAAKEAVKERGLNYGTPEDNSARIARLWQVHLANRMAGPLTASDVALMMILLKVARLENMPSHTDSWVDIAGYAACGGSMTAREWAQKQPADLEALFEGIQNYSKETTSAPSGEYGDARSRHMSRPHDG